MYRGLTSEVTHKDVAEVTAGCLEVIAGKSCRVSGGDDAWVVEQWSVRRIGLHRVDVQSDAAEVTVLQVFEGGVIVNDAAASNVDQQCALFEAGDDSAIDKRRLAWLMACGDNDAVGIGDGPERLGCWEHNVEGVRSFEWFAPDTNEDNVERGQAAGDLHADCACAYDASSRPRERAPCRLTPAAGPKSA